jgi:hypothetical protein
MRKCNAKSRYSPRPQHSESVTTTRQGDRASDSDSAEDSLRRLLEPSDFSEDGCYVGPYLRTASS